MTFTGHLVYKESAGTFFKVRHPIFFIIIYLNSTYPDNTVQVLH